MRLAARCQPSHFQDERGGAARRPEVCLGFILFRRHLQAGKIDDPMAVVAQHLKVYRIKNQQVVEGSIVLTLVSGHTEMPTYALAEIAAETIV